MFGGVYRRCWTQGIFCFTAREGGALQQPVTATSQQPLPCFAAVRISRAMSWRRRLGTRLDRSQEVAHLLYSSAALQQVTGKDILQSLRGSVDAICFAAAVGVGLRCAFTAQYHGLQDRAAESPRRFHHQDLGQSDMKGQQSMQFPLWGSMLACRLSLLGISC